MGIKFLLQEYLKERPLFLSLIRAREAELYQKFLPFDRPVLDVGVGDGYFAKVTFLNRVGPYSGSDPHQIDVGLDLQDSRIEEARKLNIYKKLVIYDGRKIPLPDNSFNTVISNCVLEHVMDLKALLKEVHRVLKRDGIFFTTVMTKPWEDHLYGAKIFGRFYKGWMRKQQVHRNLLTKNAWDETLRKSGFKIEKAIGYLTPQACQLIDICHYLSLPSLISYKLTGRWVLFPQMNFVYSVDYLTNILSKDINSDQSGAIFYVLRK